MAKRTFNTPLSNTRQSHTKLDRNMQFRFAIAIGGGGSKKRKDMEANGQGFSPGTLSVARCGQGIV
eukprot:3073352-Amphidinium_carterae.2